jgi:murein DD-endopeptidase MepM/ murein hydrolase activator NlpD
LKNLLVIFLFSLSSFVTSAQNKQLTYPRGYFLFPINPNQQNYLAGGMGDLRADHFHAGIDIKTQGREGLPVYATGDGYISEVRVQTNGYGNVIFMTHPNGFISVYGHLKTFAEPLASYIKKKRIENQTFEIKLTLKPNEFEVARGQVIGTSGNTGGSAGPHLHFEIRDTRNIILNPLNFGFTEIKDDLPPIFQQIIIKTLEIGSRINGEFGKKLFYPQKTADKTYQISQAITANGKFGLELLAVDKMNGTNNSNGISCVELLVDGNETYYSHLEQYSNEISHDINVHNDYAIEQTQGYRFQKLFQDDGNDELNIYKPIVSRGKININDGNTHQVTIRIWDAYENKATLNFIIKGEKTESSKTISPSKQPTVIKHQIEDNTLLIKATNLKTINSVATLKFAKSTIDLPISYAKNNEATYLWDLKKGLPDSILIDGTTKATNLKKIVIPAEQTNFETDGLSLNFEYNTLYDTLYLQTVQMANTLIIGEPTVPLRNKFDIEYQPSIPILLPDKTSVYYLSKRERTFLKTQFKQNKLSFSSKKLGKFEILTDTLPPKASIIRKTPDVFMARISDNLSGIKNFKAFINDQYILTDYDAKSSTLWSVKSDSTQKLYGKLKLVLEDNQGNLSAFETTIDSLKTSTLPVKINTKSKRKNESKSRRQSPQLRAKRPKRKHR